jgi:hypothetical protein
MQEKPMSNLALPIPSWRTGAPVARWLALFLFLAGIALPDCCLNGSHAIGSSMERFGAICRARV